MPVIFTICSNNYLGQAIVLGKSVASHYPNKKLITILVDHLHPTVDYANLPFETIAIADVEPQINELANKYNIIELNTCIKPQAFKYLFEKYPNEQIIYLDPDVELFGPLTELDEIFTTANIILTPHVLSPVDFDHHLPSENTFLNYGLYNLGFIAVRNTDESQKFLNWWRARTYTNGFVQLEDGVFVDQLYINLAPIFFSGVHLFNHLGYNMAPWNLHERQLSKEESGWKVNGQYDLRFFHFGSFRFNSIELPLRHYNRFTLAKRSDLKPLYEAYNQKLTDANYPAYAALDCTYYEQYVDGKMVLIAQTEQRKWKTQSAARRLVLSVISKSLIKSLADFFANTFKSYPYSDDSAALKKKYRI